MFTIPKEIISYLDTFKDHHGGTITFIASAVSLIAISKSMLNTWSLNEQANIQREIQNNRYKLELFDKRFKVYSDFKSYVFSSRISLTHSSEELRDILEKLKENILYTEKCSLMFASGKALESLSSFSDDTKKLFEELSNATNVKLLIEKKEKVLEDIISRNPIIVPGVNNSYVSIIEKKEEEVDNFSLEYTKKLFSTLSEFETYGEKRKCCEKDMEPLLSVPEQAFEKRPWFYVTWSQWLNSFKVKRPVMFWLSSTCLLALIVLLCW